MESIVARTDLTARSRRLEQLDRSIDMHPLSTCTASQPASQLSHMKSTSTRKAVCRRLKSMAYRPLIAVQQIRCCLLDYFLRVCYSSCVLRVTEVTFA